VGGRLCQEGFSYSSDTNTLWLTADELRQMIGLQSPLTLRKAA
jgi:hypothetical protein